MCGEGLDQGVISGPGLQQAFRSEFYFHTLLRTKAYRVELRGASLVDTSPASWPVPPFG